MWHLCQTYGKCLIEEKNYLKATARQGRMCFLSNKGNHGQTWKWIWQPAWWIIPYVNPTQHWQGNRLQPWIFDLTCSPENNTYTWINKILDLQTKRTKNTICKFSIHLFLWFTKLVYRVSNRRFNSGLLQLALAADVVKCEQQMVLITYVGR